MMASIPVESTPSRYNSSSDAASSRSRGDGRFAALVTIRTEYQTDLSEEADPSGAHRRPRPLFRPLTMASLMGWNSANTAMARIYAPGLWRYRRHSYLIFSRTGLKISRGADTTFRRKARDCTEITWYPLRLNRRLISSERALQLDDHV